MIKILVGTQLVRFPHSTLILGRVGEEFSETVRGWKAIPGRPLSRVAIAICKCQCSQQVTTLFKKAGLKKYKGSNNTLFKWAHSYPTTPTSHAPRTLHANCRIGSSTKFQSSSDSRFYPPNPNIQSQKYPPTTLYKSFPSLPIPTVSEIPPFQAQKFPKPSNSQELALPTEILEDSRNKGVVTALYEALNRRDAETIQQILAPDLEWWFHGPPSDQFLMRLLTGDKDSAADDFFRFVPHSISAFGPTVLAEGFDPTRSIAWVHAWTVTDGIITQVREYFNTSLTVTRIGTAAADQSDCSIASLYCPSVWESSLPGRVGKSVPGLVLAI